MVFITFFLERRMLCVCLTSVPVLRINGSYKGTQSPSFTHTHYFPLTPSHLHTVLVSCECQCLAMHITEKPSLLDRDYKE